MGEGMRWGRGRGSREEEKKRKNSKRGEGGEGEDEDEEGKSLTLYQTGCLVYWFLPPEKAALFSLRQGRSP